MNSAQHLLKLSFSCSILLIEEIPCPIFILEWRFLVIRSFGFSVKRMIIPIEDREHSVDAIEVYDFVTSDLRR